MKIIVVAPGFSRDLVYGTNVQISGLVKRLVRNEGYDVTIITEKHQPKFRKDKLACFDLRFVKTGAFHTPLLPATLKEISKIAREERADAVYIRNSISFCCISAILEKLTGIPVFHCVDVPWCNTSMFSLLMFLLKKKKETRPVHEEAQGGKLKSLLKWGLGNVSSLIVTSEHIRDIVRSVDEDLNSPQVIYPGICLPKRESNSTSKIEEQSILYMGALTEWRGVLDLTIALAQVVKKRSNTKLIIASPRKDFHTERRLGRIIEHYKLSHNIVFSGFSSNVNEELLKPSSIVCLPFISVGVDPPLTILESMAMEKPVVSTRVAGIPEFVVDGRTGFLINPQDKDMLANKLGELLEDDISCRDVGQNARRLIKKKCDWDLIIKETSRAFDMALNRV